MLARFASLISIVAILLAFLPSGATAAPLIADCQYVLGFKALHDLIPAQVGECKVDEYHNPQNGDGLQDATGGLLVWRKADNWTAFTDGYRTWINGPAGIEQRLNTERFCWEPDANCRATPTPTARPAPAPSGPPAGASAICRDGSYSYSQTRSGTCSYHGGVVAWLR